jgi:hypothetical protein
VKDAAAVAAIVTDNRADAILQFSSPVESGGAATQKLIALKDVFSS